MNYDPENFKYYLSIFMGAVAIVFHKSGARWAASKNFRGSRIPGARQLGPYEGERLLRVVYIVVGMVFILLGWIGLGHG